MMLRCVAVGLTCLVVPPVGAATGVAVAPASTEPSPVDAVTLGTVVEAPFDVSAQVAPSSPGAKPSALAGAGIHRAGALCPLPGAGPGTGLCPCGERPLCAQLLSCGAVQLISNSLPLPVMCLKYPNKPIMDSYN